jgi:hypothetical protein
MKQLQACNPLTPSQACEASQGASPEEFLGMTDEQPVVTSPMQAIESRFRARRAQGIAMSSGGDDVASDDLTVTGGECLSAGSNDVYESLDKTSYRGQDVSRGGGVVLTDASWDRMAGCNIGKGPIMVHQPLHHEHVHPTGSFHVSTDDRIQMDVDLPQVTPVSAARKSRSAREICPRGRRPRRSPAACPTAPGPYQHPTHA